jgi:hypothetical protein
MNWLEDIRNKPHHQKIRIIWTVTGIVCVFLIVVWIVSYKFARHVPADTTLFKTIGRGFNDIQKNYKNIPAFNQAQQQQQ